MREILFRAKAKEDGMWIEGFPVRIYDYGGLVWDMHPFNTNFEITRSVDPKTICQFTGLTDKNGKKIFEGDVVLYSWNDQDKPERFTIKFKDGQFVASPVKETEDYWDFMVGGYSKEMEVIGNIHDNPELLENP